MVRQCLLGLLLLPASSALADGHAVGVKVGGMGLGAEYTYALNDRIAFRGALYGSQLGFDADQAGIDYQLDVAWDSVTVGVDFHPLKSALRLSAGLMDSANELRVFSRPTGNLTIGNTTYTPAQIGTLEGVVAFDGTATFAGLGWDWSRDKRLFGMSLDLGILDQGRPAATLRGTGPLLGNPAFERDVDAEERELTQAVSDLDLVPYASVGLVFRF